MPTGRTQHGSTAVATREPEQTPALAGHLPRVVAAIEERLPTIAAMLPPGMSADRFRSVVVQAIARNQSIASCDGGSIVLAVMEAAEAGLEPTGALGKAWLIPYGTKATFIIGWRGYAELAWRADRVLLTTGAVREGDAFEYRRGTGAYLHHTENLDDPERDVDDENITFVWCKATWPDGREDFEVMSRAAVQRIVDGIKAANPVWRDHWGEMARKTVLRRLVKRIPLSPSVSRFLASDEAVDFDSPVERVAADQVRQLPAGSSRTEQAQARAAALRDEPEPPAEPEPEPQEPEPALDVDDIPFSGPAEEQTAGEAVASSSVASAGDCTHPGELHEVRESGVVCRNCGEVLASRDAPEPPREKPYRERLNARIHVDRTHAQAKVLCAAVLGLDPDTSTWSMADLSEEQLAMVVGALEASGASRPMQDLERGRGRRRQPAGARR